MAAASNPKLPDYIHEIQEMVPEKYAESLESIEGPYELPEFYEYLGQERFLGLMIPENDHLTDGENLYLQKEKLTESELENLDVARVLEGDLERPETAELEILEPKYEFREGALRTMADGFAKVVLPTISCGVVSEYVFSPGKFGLLEFAGGYFAGFAIFGTYYQFHYKKKEERIIEENTEESSNHILEGLWDTEIYIADENARAALKSNQNISELDGVLEEVRSELDRKHWFSNPINIDRVRGSDEQTFHRGDMK